MYTFFSSFGNILYGLFIKIIIIIRHFFPFKDFKILGVLGFKGGRILGSLGFGKLSFSFE